LPVFLSGPVGGAENDILPLAVKQEGLFVYSKNDGNLHAPDTTIMMIKESMVRK
jgi:hypothetical protein